MRAGLQELAAGIHPSLLTERGIGPALASLIERTPVPVRLVAPHERLPTAVEAAVYFVCAEALIAEGRSNLGIAETLVLSTKTVEAHVGRIMAKLGLDATPDYHRRVLAVLAFLRS